MTTRDEIVERVAQVLQIDPEDDEEMEEADVVLFDGMEDAFIGVAERFVEGGHRHFAVYSYRKMVDILTLEPGTTSEDAVEYLEFNTVGLYAGPGTPAILRDYEEHL